MGVSLSFLPHPVSISSGGLGWGGEETSGPHPGALVLVQVPGPPPPPAVSGVDPAISYKKHIVFLRAVSSHVLLSAACQLLLGSGDPVSTAESPLAPGTA